MILNIIINKNLSDPKSSRNSQLSFKLRIVRHIIETSSRVLAVGIVAEFSKELLSLVCYSCLEREACVQAKVAWLKFQILSSSKKLENIKYFSYEKQHLKFTVNSEGIAKISLTFGTIKLISLNTHFIHQIE
ncbi:hypothetical protein BpHYR1_005460 [Brachionus plicatilis]|uniref:Uncharacterized protein n=1 Tax=Brachionus plicatilis TaxID=10195 RepID=A0A3M7S2W4_BRAPC|nr:hypothetical protein BpHYR1_005460 [Brachionus plicatilis]